MTTKSFLLSCIVIILFLGYFISISFAQPSIGGNNKSNTTSVGSIDVKLESIPSSIRTGQAAKYLVTFLKKGTDNLQRHVDFDFTVLKNNITEIFSAAKNAGLPVLHSARGGEVIPFSITEPGDYTIRVSVMGIDFTPISNKYAEFSVKVV